MPFHRGQGVDPLPGDGPAMAGAMFIDRRAALDASQKAAAAGLGPRVHADLAHRGVEINDFLPDHRPSTHSDFACRDKRRRGASAPTRTVARYAAAALARRLHQPQGFPAADPSGGVCPSSHIDDRSRRSRVRRSCGWHSGQLGPDAFTSPGMKETMDLCVSCKGCKRDCPTGVDMARMKIEFLHHYHDRHGLPLREQLIAHLPRYARYASLAAPLLNLRDRIPLIARRYACSCP
ncbi:4Fe-4S dicluster domain-containing protein [Paracoccus mutanolyticus]|uniref:4Fe-4S dicluster domain-containing protein n=1 Tax=Paracoccus mutanolyticus TaxID=1499308 RepID=UPI001CB9876A|nr:4Fe-4S dicluster domain-containing protein [Paracoccus mutanolyticus]